MFIARDEQCFQRHTELVSRFSVVLNTCWSVKLCFVNRHLLRFLSKHLSATSSIKLHWSDVSVLSKHLSATSSIIKYTAKSIGQTWAVMVFSWPHSRTFDWEHKIQHRPLSAKSKLIMNVRVVGTFERKCDFRNRRTINVHPDPMFNILFVHKFCDLKSLYIVDSSPVPPSGRSRPEYKKVLYTSYFFPFYFYTSNLYFFKCTPLCITLISSTLS